MSKHDDDCVRITVKLPRDLREWLEKRAGKNFTSMSLEVMFLLKEQRAAEQARR
jgi:hypothetical protein